jgi:hypothetical protein
VNAIDVCVRQLHRRVAVALHEALVAETKSEYLRHAVLMIQAEDNRADDVVYSWAQAATGNNAAHELRRIEVQTLSRTGHLQRRSAGVQLRHGRGIEHSFVLADEANPG